MAATLVTASLGCSAIVITGCGTESDPSQAQADLPPTPEISLEAAIIDGDNHAVRAHIIAGTPVDTPNMAGDTPLSVASVLGRTYAAECLINAGAQLEAKNNAGTTPLFNAAFFCQPKTLQALIDAGANTSTTDSSGTSIQQVMRIPWEQIKPVYESIYASIGMPMDEERIKSARPSIAAMLP